MTPHRIQLPCDCGRGFHTAQHTNQYFARQEAEQQVAACKTHRMRQAVKREQERADNEATQEMPRCNS